MNTDKIVKLASNLMIELIKTDLPNKEINRLNEIVGDIRDEAINYSRCCESDSEQLKSEIDTEFEKFVEANTNKQKIAPMYWHNDKCFWSRDDLYKWWLENKETL